MAAPESSSKLTPKRAPPKKLPALDLVDAMHVSERDFCEKRGVEPRHNFEVGGTAREERQLY